MSKPIFIAHRGYARHYPENTLIGIEAALNAGAKFIEIDIQLTADHVPVLFHDGDLFRITGHHGNINDITLGQLKNLRASEPERFHDRYQHIHIPSLAEFVEMLYHWPDAKTFAEIKTESLDRFGNNKVTQIVLDTIAPLKDRCIPISYDHEALQYARMSGAHKIGWILKCYDDQFREIANKLLPDYLICNYTKIPPSPTALWPGPWTWALYEITDPSLAISLTNRGIGMIETMEIGEMLQHPLIQNRLSDAE